MNTRFEDLAEFLLTGIMERTLSDAAVYEFIGECSKSIQEEAEIPWTGAVEELWDYLTISRTAPSHNEQNGADAFRQGQLFAAMELVKMMQESRESEIVLKQDARSYDEHWHVVFDALRSGESLTHGELAKVCEKSDSSLSQFLHKIEQKRYISYRKVGRTKYYRLSTKGKKLLSYMPSEQRRIRPNYGLGIFSSYIEAVRTLYELNMFSMPIQKPLYKDLISIEMNDENTITSIFDIEPTQQEFFDLKQVMSEVTENLYVAM